MNDDARASSGERGPHVRYAVRDDVAVVIAEEGVYVLALGADAVSDAPFLVSGGGATMLEALHQGTPVGLEDLLGLFSVEAGERSLVAGQAAEFLSDLERAGIVKESHGVKHQRPRGEYQG